MAENSQILDIEKLGAEERTKQLLTDADNQEITISSEFFENPINTEIFFFFSAAFGTWLRDKGVDPQSIAALSKRLPAYFTNALHETWIHNRTHFSNIQGYFDSPFFSHGKEIEARNAYVSWLVKQANEKVFEALIIIPPKTKR